MTDELDELRRLLGASRKEEVEEVRHRIEDTEVRAQDVASVLAESISLAGRRGDDLTRALEAPVEACIQQSVRRDTQLFADALFPVMGPAIRRSIVETLKSFVDSINRTIEQSVSVRGIGWRIEALRTGVPFAEVLLKHTLVYRVEEVFLIHKESGLLIEHVAHADVATEDSDAVSGMLSAIRDFVNDSFARGGNDELGRIDMGERTLWIIDGPYAIIAAVVRGMAPPPYPDFLRERIEQLHAGYSHALEAFAGDAGAVPGARSALEECLWDAYQDGAKKTRKGGVLSPGGLILSGALLGLVAWFAWTAWQDRAIRDGLERALGEHPGLVLLKVLERDGVYRVQGLRDPLADNPAALLVAEGLALEDLDFAWRPYQSLDAPIVLRRAQAVLDPPAGVRLAYDAGELRAEGVAGEAWTRTARALAASVPGVTRYDDRALRLDWSEVRERARATLQPPDEIELEVRDGGRLIAAGLAEQTWIDTARRLAATVQGVQSYDDGAVEEWNAHLLRVAQERLAPPGGVELAVAAHTLRITGVAPLAWKRAVVDALGEVAGLAGVELTGLKVAEYVEARAIVAGLDNANVRFADETDFLPGSLDVLQDWRRKLLRLEALGREVGIRYRATVTGYTDEIGAPQFNQKLSIARAETAVRWLIEHGVPGPRLVAQGSLYSMPGVQNRRAQIVLKVNGFDE